MLIKGFVNHLSGSTEHDESVGALLLNVRPYRTPAQAVAEGANRVNGVDVTIKRVPETMTPEAFAKAGGKQHQQAQVASPQELADYDGIIFGTPTRFGNMAGQMRTFLDQTGGLWASGALYGKVGSVFSSTGTGGGRGTHQFHGPRWRTTVSSSCRSAMPRQSCLTFRRYAAAPRMAPPPSPAPTVRGNRATKS